MAVNFSDALFPRAVKQLSFEAQKYLEESGLDDPSVLECFLSDPLGSRHVANRARVRTSRLAKKVIGPIKVHVDNKGIIDWLWREERRCIDPKAGVADLWIKIWEELHYLVSKENLMEVEHVKAHRTKKDKTYLSDFEKFVTEGNEKADELAKEGAMLDEGNMVETRAKTAQQEREEVNAALQYVACFHCLAEEWKDCECSSRSRKKSASLWKRKERKRNIERSGAPRPTSIGA